MRAFVVLAVSIVALAACAPARPPVAQAVKPVAPPAADPRGAVTPTPAPLRVPGVEWRPADRWVFEWSVGSDTGTKTAEVVEQKTISGATFYVVRIGE